MSHTPTKPHPSSQQRCIIHVDLDCFYVQVERKLNPSLQNTPCAVVQYNAWQGGSIIALSYEAKAMGVKRSMRGNEAKKICPSIQLVTVRVKNEKADLSMYREAGSEVFECCGSVDGVICERTSIDEAYLDVTALAHDLVTKQQQQQQLEPNIKPQNNANEECGSPLLNYNTNVVLLKDSTKRNEWIQDTIQNIHSNSSNENDLLLIAASTVVQRIRDLVLQQTGYTISAGIASNKTLSKLVSGLYKPNQQTLCRDSHTAEFLSTMPLRDMNGFGGKLGDGLMEQYHIVHVGDLVQYNTNQLEEMVSKILGGRSEEARQNTAHWIHDTCRGIDTETVKPKLKAETIGCSKTFTGLEILRSKTSVEHYLLNQAIEIHERLTAHYGRYREYPTRLVLSWSCEMKKVRRKGMTVNVVGGGGTASVRYPSTAMNFLQREDNEESVSEQVKILASLAFSVVMQKHNKSHNSSGSTVVTNHKDHGGGGGAFEFTGLGMAANGFEIRVEEHHSIKRIWEKAAAVAAASPSPLKSSSSSSSLRMPQSWEDIDKSILAEIPPEMQRELQQDHAIKPRKRKLFKQNTLAKSFQTMREKNNTLIEEASPASSSSLSHVIPQDWDESVFNNLPNDIREELMQSQKQKSPIRSITPPSSSSKQKKKGKGVVRDIQSFFSKN